MPNPCGYTHPKDQPCRLCEAALARLKRSSAAERRPVKPVVVGSNPTASAKEKAAAISEVVLPASDAVPPSMDKRSDTQSSEASHEAANASPSSKSDRLAVAEEAVEETLKRYRAKAAARQKRFRERRKG